MWRVTPTQMARVLVKWVDERTESVSFLLRKMSPSRTRKSPGPEPTGYGVHPGASEFGYAKRLVRRSATGTT